MFIIFFMLRQYSMCKVAPRTKNYGVLDMCSSVVVSCPSADTQYIYLVFVNEQAFIKHLTDKDRHNTHSPSFPYSGPTNTI